VLRLTTLAMRVSAVGLSGVVHAAILLTPFGHANPARGPSLEPTLLESVDVEVEPAPNPAPALPDAPLDNRVSAAPTHTHPYPVPEGHDSTPHDPSLVHVAMPAPLSPPQAGAPTAEAPVADTSTVVKAADSREPPRFTIALSFGAPGAGGLASKASPGGGHADGDADGDGSGTLSEQAVDSPARLLRGGTPSYPSEARADGVEADVKLELVVSAAGSVEDVRVVRRAGHGLDEAATLAARQFRFTPAVKHGRAVRVRMSWAVEFRLD
jgi:TonB family protein